MGARYFDPLVSRFISPDPLLNPADPKTLDAYMYAKDNPVMFSDPSGLYAQGDEQVCGHYGCVGATTDPNTVGVGLYGYGTPPSSGGTGSAGGPGGTAASPAPPLSMELAQLTKDDVNSQFSWYVPPTPDDGSVYFNGNWCIPGSACYEDSLSYHHNPAMDKALIDAIIGNDIHGCFGGGSGFWGTAGHCVSLGMTVIPGVGEVGDGLKGGKIVTALAKVADDSKVLRAGSSALDSLAPGIRSAVDDAISRAASGKVRFPGHDGKVYNNLDGALPRGGSYTEWTAADAGAKRGADRVIIDGDPANPTAIYYWDHVNPPVKVG